MDNDAIADQSAEMRSRGVGNEEPIDNDPDLLVEPVVITPVMDGAQELQAEAAAAIESGEVDLSDPRHGDPSAVENPAGPDGSEGR